MPPKGSHQSLESKTKMSQAHKQLPCPSHFNPGWFKGKQFSLEHRAHLSQALKGRDAWNKGQTIGPYSLERRATLSEAHKGQQSWCKGLTKETSPIVKRISEKMMGHIGYFRGKRFSLEHRANLSGPHSGRWKGGISFEPYAPEFNSVLKEQVRQRDNYQCQLCHKTERKLPVHHIDYNKRNNNSDNLISLCRSCHSKTNERREFWKQYLKAINHWRARPITSETLCWRCALPPVQGM